MWRLLRPISSRLDHGRYCVSVAAGAAKEMQELMELFAEARELISEARESVGTVYFGDDLEDAIKSKDDVLTQWTSLQKRLEIDGAHDVLTRMQREYDVKFRQLQAEVEELMSHDA
jgi:hypothetical protein